MCAAMPEPRNPRAGGVFLFIGIFLGVVIGTLLGHPVIGAIVGLAIGTFIVLAIWLLDRR